MAKFTQYKPGQFSWIDLTSTDQDKSEAFYTQLFGWKAVHEDSPQGGHYTMFTYKDGPVAGLGQMNDEMKSQGVPSMWNSYVSVENVADVAGRVEGLGGKVMVPPMDVMDHGRLAFLVDSTGAMVGLWEPKAHVGAAICNEPNALCWNELASSDLGKSKKFYGDLFGWTYEESDTPAGPYVSAKLNDAPNGGMMNKPEMAAKMPDYWAVYIAVADVDGCVSKIKELGGQVMFEPTEIPDVGRFAWAMDPTNAAFVVLQMKEGLAT